MNNKIVISVFISTASLFFVLHGGSKRSKENLEAAAKFAAKKAATKKAQDEAQAKIRAQQKARNDAIKAKNDAAAKAAVPVQKPAPVVPTSAESSPTEEIEGVPKWFYDQYNGSGKNPVTAWEYFSNHGSSEK